MALPESKEEFNFQIERWIQRLIDRVIRYSDEFKEQTAQPDIEMLSSALRNAPLSTVVPDEWTVQDAVKFCRKLADKTLAQLWTPGTPAAPPCLKRGKYYLIPMLIGLVNFWQRRMA